MACGTPTTTTTWVCALRNARQVCPLNPSTTKLKCSLHAYSCDCTACIRIVNTGQITSSLARLKTRTPSRATSAPPTPGKPDISLRKLSLLKCPGLASARSPSRAAHTSFSGKDFKTISCDEEYTNVNISKIPTLKPSFKKDGVVTAANASTLNDGASAMLLMSRAKAAALGLKPLAVIRGYADAEQAPVDFSTTPSLALPKAYSRAGLTQANVDLFEINEAFAAVALANMQILGISHSQINISGGAVALGHPIGSSGCRIIVTLIHNLIRTNKAIGAAGICNGGGGASAVVVERL
jgi:hypothetical protein